jgi:hypothetical protein
VGVDANVIAETLEVLVEMEDADGSALGGRGNRQVGQGVPVSSVRAGGSQLAHRCQNRALNAAIHRDLTQSLQCALDGGDPLWPPSVDDQLVADRPAPASVSTLDRAQQQAARPRVAASLHPG